MNPPVTIRHSGARDRPAFGQIDPRAASDLVRRAKIDAAAAARRCWVAERKGRLIGYGVLTEHFYDRPFIDIVYVAEDSRRSGGGSALLEAIERSISGDRIFTSTNESNEPMRALLLKRGYAPSGHIENLDSNDPELVFVKFLRR
jgi:GNAT superfamily N-acetyltransferase